jgi:hypothetical protein
MRVPRGPVSYTNRRGQIYYLHRGLTKTGKQRYFVAKTIGEGALAQIPDGFELVESINGVVSVRRVDPNAPKVPDADLARVRTELARQPHLQRHRADVVKGEIVVFEPVGGLPDRFLGDLATRFGSTPDRLRELRELQERTRYTPVLKLVPSGDDYMVCRMTYRGSGGWSGPYDGGSLHKLVKKYVPSIGTDRFFQHW